MPVTLSGEVLSVADVGARIPAELGGPVNSNTVYVWITKGLFMQPGKRVKLEALRLERTYLIPKAALRKFLKALANRPSKREAIELGRLASGKAS
jgi:hypothetical protein